jgi:hypothetical protein
MTGRPSIPETLVIVPRSRGVLDRPVKPGDDSLFMAGTRAMMADGPRPYYAARILSNVPASHGARPFASVD